MPLPPWQAATSGQQGLAGHVNQLLGSHPATLLYAGVQRAAQTTGGGGYVSSAGTWIAQQFTTASGQTTIGYLVLVLYANISSGSSLAPITVGLYANSGGAPSGSPLVTATVTSEYSYAAPLNMVVPLPATGLTASTTYWIVTTPVGNGTYYYAWNKSNQASGASTSATGTSWTAQSYGLEYQVYDQSATGPLTCTWSDSGARWTWIGYNGSGLVNQYAEYTAGQTPAGYLQSFRNLTYSGSLLTGVN